MPAPFPHQYSASVRRTFASRARVEAPPRVSLHGGPSSEFDGDAAAWSPEHLLLSSLGTCMLTTFEAFAARDGIELVRWDATVNGTVERTPEGLMFTSVVLSIDMAITGDVAKVEATLEDSKQYCLVLNSLRVPVVIETEIATPEATDDHGDAPFRSAMLGVQQSVAG
ncbi:MAG: OsmC family protein [Myxococcota bacterium]|nr:OsmC family protein [Myxococcota bacterium]